MTIGDLIDQLEEGIRIGDLNRLDELLAEGTEEDSDLVQVLEVRRISGTHVVITVNAELR